MKKMLSLLLAVVMSLSLVTTAFAADFKDTVDIPQSDAVDVIETLGIVNGYGDNVYGPNDILNRAQLCTMLTRAIYGDPIYTSHINFTDVPVRYWAYDYINTAYVYGLMHGYGGGLFGPDDDITYTQMAAVIMKATGYDISKMSWPTGVNTMGQSLGLFKNVIFVDYSDGCTRANAAQMLYNAFDISLVNHKSDYPVAIKNSSFLEDVLGYEEVTDIVDGHWYTAYINLNDGDKVTTDNCLTTETTIYPTDENTYRFKNSSKSHNIDWYWLDDDTDGFVNDVKLYVNGTEITEDSEKIFAACGKATGVFYDDELVAILVISEGEVYIPYIIDRPDIYEYVKNDKDFEPGITAAAGTTTGTSTITYFDETNEYVISNKVTYGWVTDLYKSVVYVNGTKIDLADVTVAGILVEDEFVKIYYDYLNKIVAIEVITDPYIYDVTDGVYHTWGCEVWGETVNHISEKSIADLDGPVLPATEVIYEFEVCDKCEASRGERHDGKDFTIIVK